MVSWFRVFLVIIWPLLILCLGLSAAVFIGYIISWLANFGATSSNAFGFLHVPKSMKINLEAPLVVGNFLMFLYFLWLLILQIRAAHRNHLTFKQFALLPLKRRRELTQGPPIQQKPQNPFG
jgi:hypothetical protein